MVRTSPDVPPVDRGKYRSALKEIEKMSPKKFRKKLQKLGIIEANGKLTAKYARHG
jgi:hypothetical protein